MSPVQKLFSLFAIGYPAFVFIDILWIGFIMQSTYRTHIGHLMKMSNGSAQINWPAALTVWALIVFGALVFALPRATDSLFSGFLWGALYGLVLYGVYDLTNLAMIDTWPLIITYIDIAWGMLANALLVTLLVWLRAKI